MTMVQVWLTPLLLICCAALWCCRSSAEESIKYQIHDEIVREIWTGENPLDFANPDYVDHGYPHTNLRPLIVETVLKKFKTDFWLEVGSMIGNSAILTATAMQKLENNHTSIVCIDPFTGDVNMLAWEKGFKAKKEWLFARNEKGRCSIYDRFRANIVDAKLKDRIVPIQATGIVGMKTLLRLKNEGRLSSLPGIIYLDSAHELDETTLELRTAWSLLPPNGVLLGDDWGWDAVRHDVTKFVHHLTAQGHVNIELGKELAGMLPSANHEEVPGAILVDGQWIIIKK